MVNNWQNLVNIVCEHPLTSRTLPCLFTKGKFDTYSLDFLTPKRRLSPFYLACKRWGWKICWVQNFFPGMHVFLHSRCWIKLWEFSKVSCSPLHNSFSLLKPPDPGEDRQVISIKEVINHPDYDWDLDAESEYDISIVKLKTPLTFTNNVKRACLPESSFTPQSTDVGFSTKAAF